MNNAPNNNDESPAKRQRLARAPKKSHSNVSLSSLGDEGTHVRLFL